MDLLLGAFILFTFIVGILSVKMLIGYHQRKGIADVNYARADSKKIALAGGIGLVVPLWISSLLFIHLYGYLFEVLGVAILVSAFAIIGYIDDRNPKYSKKALGWKIRALPLAITSLLFAFFFSFEPIFLWIIPLTLFVSGFTSLVNTFEGLNGWGIGTGTIILFFISVYLYISWNPLFVFGLILTTIALALLWFNKFPAKTLPGDSGTLFIGSSIVGLTLIANDLLLILLVVLFFIPALIDFFILKMISNSKNMSQSNGKPYKILKNGKLTLPKGKVTMDFAKLLMKIFGPLYEWQVVLLIWGIVIINCTFWLSVILLF